MEEKNMEYAKKLINNFCIEEYGIPANFKNLSDVNIAYTSDEERANENSLNRLDIQVRLDLRKFVLKQYINEVLVEDIKYSTLKDLIEKELEHLDFDSLVSLDDENIDKYRENKTKITKTEKER